MICYAVMKNCVSELEWKNKIRFFSNPNEMCIKGKTLKKDRNHLQAFKVSFIL